MSQFPKLTETFVLNEMLAVERQGIDVEIYPLQRTGERLTHPGVAGLVARARFYPWLSLRILRSHWHFLIRGPWIYLATLARLLWANFGSLRYFAGAIAFFPKAVHIAHQMRQTGVNHVHAHFASHPAAVAWIICRLTGIPFSFTAHGSDLHRDRHMLAEKVAQAKFVVAISNYNRDLMVRECGDWSRSKIHVIHCGVDTTLFAANQAAQADRSKPGPLQVLCIGTLHEVKGQTYLLEACRRLHENGLDFECHLVGGGPDLAQLKRQAADSNIIERVHFHGACPQAEIVELLRHADMLVAPSVPTRDGRREGIPVVLMEAMASGVPVVASRISGIPELVIHEQTGLLTTPRDSESLAAALAELASNAALRRWLARAGRLIVEREFDLSRNSARLARRFRDQEAA
jgi:glycosyltransferase involved in cell wall biosynthesis